VTEPSELVSTQEAAQLLDLAPRSVRDLVAKGYLRPTAAGTHYKFRKSDVLLLAAMRQQGTDLPSVALMAAHSAARIAQLERQLHYLSVVLQVDIPSADLAADAVKSRHIKAQDTVGRRQHTTEEVFEWARFFYAVGEEYFDAILQHVGDTEPWQLLLKTANHLMTCCTPKLVAKDTEARAAFQYLDAARRNLYHAAYFYVRRSYGARASNALFPHATGNINAELSALANAIHA